MFGRRSKTPEELLEQSEDSDMNKRVEAVEEIGKLDKQYPETKERLAYLKDNDNEKKVRKAADKALKSTKNLPMGSPLYSESYDDPDVPDAKAGGTAGTGFDNEVGDPSLRSGEVDVESSLSKADEDAAEARAEGKGIFVTISEQNRLTLNYQGQVVEEGQSTGRVKVANSGSRNRINGIDLYLDNVKSVKSKEKIEKHTNIGMIKPGENWNREYEFKADLDVIKVEQDFLDPESNLSPNFMDGRRPTFENRITITNTLDKPIFNLEGIKVLNENASYVGSTGDGVTFSSERMEVTETVETMGSSPTTTRDDEDDDTPVEDTPRGESETRTRTADVVKFTIEEIGAGESVSIAITLEATLPDGVPAYKAGGLTVNYKVNDFLASGLGFASVDGVSDIKQKIRKKQREEEPFTYDCEVTFENKSEFVYEIKEFEVRQGDIHGDAILEWLGSNASEDEREIVPGEKVVFEFIYEDKDKDGNPAFGQHLEFEVQDYNSVASMFELSLPSENLKFMALEIKKAYLDENGEETREFNIPSYVETAIPAKISVTGMGTYPLDNVEIVEEIPKNFKFGESDEIKVSRNGNLLSDDQYEVTFGDPHGPKDETGEATEGRSAPVTKADLAGGSRMQINLYDLQDTDDGPFAKDEMFTVEYQMIAENLVPQDDPIKTYAFTEGYTNELPDSRVHDEISGEDELIFNVVHLRDDLDIGKYVMAISHNGGNAYSIQLEAENYGTSTQTLVIRDLVPSGFDLVSGSMTSNPEIETDGPEKVDEGEVYTWTFEKVGPNEAITASYMLVQSTDDANPRMLQKVYQG